MKIDYSSGLVLSNGDLLEATYESRFGWDGNINWVERRIYTGCYITKPNGDKIWYSNNWSDIEPLPITGKEKWSDYLDLKDLKR